jgi:predicted Rossmann fold flavoprotein
VNRLPLAVVGAGAAGLLAAIFAARGGQQVVLIDGRRRPGAKILVSGGGRCNVLPVHMVPEDYFTGSSKNAMRNILCSWPLAQMRHFFEVELGVPLKEEATGKVFPRSDSARNILAGLMDEVHRLGVVCRFGTRVVGLRRAAGPAGQGLDLQIEGADSLLNHAVVLACGGLSMPRTGSDGTGFRLAKALGHTVRAPYPALVPLTGDSADFRALSGVALPVRLSTARGKFLGSPPGQRISGDLLFTHRGFSGPAALNISRHVTAPHAGSLQVTAHFNDAVEWPTVLQESPQRSCYAALHAHIPKRLAEVLLRQADLAPERPVGTLTRPQRLRLQQLLCACVLPHNGSEGYATAEVTAGGIPLEEMVTRTLESRLCPGLYIAGEMLDVTGKLGGYNFLWAWASGRRVGMAAAMAAMSQAA